MLQKQTSYINCTQKEKKNTTVLKLFDYAPYSMLLYGAAERDREK